ncbi:MAG TPA: hypothetical protein VL381_08405, partial [Rhodocyclaceae bacterium]|nr:hypothetical protein [Rhodocyclaceae bacterium]
HCVAGTEWTWDGVRFLILHPGYDAYDLPGRKTNDMSCVLKVTSHFGSVLLTADIEARTEQALLRTNAVQLRSDVLLVPHHGSRTSSTPAFIAAVGAPIAIVPVGYRNSYRHPHPSVMTRYADSRAQIYRTDRDGALDVRYSANGITTNAERVEHARYWHNQQENQ